MKLFNSLTRSVEQFKPNKPKNISMYVCGITPYDTTHLGHAFTYVSFDGFFRYLKYKGYKITYVQNVTDIDDDILRKARETKRDWKKLGEFWTNKFLKDMKTLNVLPPTHYVKATDSIPLIVDIIKVLIKKNHAYEEKGNVYFSFQSFREYGKLSHYNERQMLLISKDRGNDPTDPRKKHPLDFILWQKSAPDEPHWESPWGEGRPGWHIECTAMINRYLGAQIDIHGGGRDLIFPHHESETAQAESYSGKVPYVKYWTHTGMVVYEGEKMGKSLGNLIMVSDLLKKYDLNVIRWLLLSHHYRRIWEFDQMELKTVAETVNLVKDAAKNTKHEKIDPDEQIECFLDCDFQTNHALDIIHQYAHQVLDRDEKADKKAKTIKYYLDILGFTL